MKNETKSKPQDPVEKLKKLLEQRGRKALSAIRNVILEEKVESTEAQSALSYFAANWRDTSRPALLAMVCEAVGGKPELTTPIAVSLSLISGGYDIHDDIVDLSTSKNGKATVFGKFGKDTTLLIGDALILKGFTFLNKSLNSFPQEKQLLILDIINKMFFELFDAEMLELQFRGKLDINPEKYLKIIKKKAADVEAHTRIGAIIGGASVRQVKALGEYGRALGMLIILRDEFLDVLDLEEAKHRYEREHLPLPVVYAIQSPETKRRVAKLISKKPMSQENLIQIQKITKTSRGFRMTQMTVQKILKEALAQLAYIRNNEELQHLAKGTSYLSLDQEE